MSSATYVRYEVLRSVRNKRFFLFSLGFPVALYVLSAAGNGDTRTSPTPAYRSTSTTWPG